MKKILKFKKWQNFEYNICAKVVSLEKILFKDVPISVNCMTGFL